MNTRMTALLQGRWGDAASSLQQRLRALDPATDETGEAEIAGELSQVIHALDALRTGRYGYCGECEQPVELDQLLTKPHRLLCISCESHEMHEAHGDFAALVRCVPSPWLPPFHSPAILPESAKIRGELTMRAFSGAASGTLMISIRKSDVVESNSAEWPEHPANSLGERTTDVPDP